VVAETHDQSSTRRIHALAPTTVLPEKEAEMDERKWASGRWQVKAGKENEFIQRWTAWLTWTSENVPGFRSARLLRSEDDPGRFTSFSDWDDDASVKAWKMTSGYEEKLGPVKELCDEFMGGDFDLAASVKAPVTSS
jgi:heme-degrading monooxygenase HmoA